MDAASRIWGFESWDSQKYKIIKFKGIGYILNLPNFFWGGLAVPDSETHRHLIMPNIK